MVVSTTFFVAAPQLGAVADSFEGEAADVILPPQAARSAVFTSDGNSPSGEKAQFISYLSDAENRQPIPLDDIPEEVIRAIIAVEDAEFYQHNGVNLKGITRAAVKNASSGSVVQGGSTITQQLIKNTILNAEQTADRKITEAVLATRIEKELTKDQILEHYLNEVYFGAGAYGVQAAAETYWGYEKAEEMGWGEAALLAGLIKNPTGNDPTLNPEKAFERREVILNRLVTVGEITKEEAERIRDEEEIPVDRRTPFDIKPTDYFVQEVLEQLLKDPTILGIDETSIDTEKIRAEIDTDGMSEEQLEKIVADEVAREINDLRREVIYKGGLKIYTTLDKKAQEAAEQARTDQMPESDVYTMALASIDNGCNDRWDEALCPENRRNQAGAVRAMIGGPDFKREKFNIATQGGQQPGSTMKTFVLAAALEDGYSQNDTVRGDAGCSFRTPSGVLYTPSGKGYGGRQTLAHITQTSNNCGFVRLGQIVGNQKTLNVAKRLGIDTKNMPDVLSLPLGAGDMLPIEVAGAYAAFPNDGLYSEPWYIERIEDADGKVIYEHEQQTSRAVSQQTARQITEVLEGNVDQRNGIGTGRRAKILDENEEILHPVAGKTGTTNGPSDVWFAGYSAYYTTAVWYGSPVGDEQIKGLGFNPFGGTISAPIFGQYMTDIHEGLEPVNFAEPDPNASRSRYLRVDGETEPCVSLSDGFFRGVDQDGDGVSDCSLEVPTDPNNTTTTMPDPNPGNPNQPPTTVPDQNPVTTDPNGPVITQPEPETTTVLTRPTVTIEEPPSLPTFETLPIPQR